MRDIGPANPLSVHIHAVSSAMKPLWVTDMTLRQVNSAALHSRIWRKRSVEFFCGFLLSAECAAPDAMMRPFFKGRKAA
jgi:hypothetical protein